MTAVSDDDLLSFTASTVRLGRLADALLVEAVGRGSAHIDGCDGPVSVSLPVSVARHAACVGRVGCTTFDVYGRILAIHVPDHSLSTRSPPR